MLDLARRFIWQAIREPVFLALSIALIAVLILYPPARFKLRIAAAAFGTVILAVWASRRRPSA